MKRGSLAVHVSAGLAFAILTVSPALADVDRYAAIVIDAQTREVLHADQADEDRYPASLTKMMTLYMLFEAIERGEISLSDRIVASRFAARQPPSRLGVRRGDSLSVEQAIRALVVNSANDVAVMVAERLGGTETRFAARMTARARELGMTHTRFMNASGLPNPQIRTTARDMATLSLALFNDFPQYYDYFRTPSNTWGRRTASNHNRLLGAVEGVDGIKTGYTRASGFNLASSAEREGTRVIAVVMGGSTAASRDAQVAYLIENAFEEMTRRRTLNVNPAVAATMGPAMRADVTLAGPAALPADAVQRVGAAQQLPFEPAPEELGQGDHDVIAGEEPDMLPGEADMD